VSLGHFASYRYRYTPAGAGWPWTQQEWQSAD